MTVPTLAATDAPTSGATVWYDAQSNFTGFDCWPFNPDIVLVDSQVIARARRGPSPPVWATPCPPGSRPRRPTSHGLRTSPGGVSTLAAMAIAKLGYEMLMAYGVEALRAVELGLVTPAVEKIIETNTLHSGLGFESGGLATAHMIANPLSNFPECKGLMHGEKVGFGVVTQLCLDEDTDTREMYRIIDFEIAIGLPVTFADLHLDGVTRDRLRIIGEACAGPGSLCHNHCFKVTVDGAIDAMIAADAVGRTTRTISVAA